MVARNCLRGKGVEKGSKQRKHYQISPEKELLSTTRKMPREPEILTTTCTIWRTKGREPANRDLLQKEAFITVGMSSTDSVSPPYAAQKIILDLKALKQQLFLSSHFIKAEIQQGSTEFFYSKSYRPGQNQGVIGEEFPSKYIHVVGSICLLGAVGQRSCSLAIS